MSEQISRSSMFRKSQAVDKASLARNNSTANLKINPHIFIPKTDLWAKANKSSVIEITTDQIRD